MEDEEDVVASHSIEQQPLQTKLEKSSIVSTAGDSPENPQLTAAEVVAEPSVAGDGEAAAGDERESEVETVEVSKLERGEDSSVADEFTVSSKVEVVEELKLKSEEEVGVEEGEGVEGVNEVKDVKKPTEESDELPGECVQVSGDIGVGNVEKAAEERDELPEDCVKVSDEIGVGNVEGENVGNVEEEVVKVAELVKVDEEMKVKKGGGEEEELLSNVKEGEGDESVKVEGEGVSKAEGVQMVDENAVKTDELVEGKVEDDEEGNEMVKDEDEGTKVDEIVEEEGRKEEEGKEEEGIENSDNVRKGDELMEVEKGDAKESSPVITKDDELMVEKDDGKENSPIITKSDEVVEKGDGKEKLPTITKNDESMIVEGVKEDGRESEPNITKNDELSVVEEGDGVEKSDTITKNDELMVENEPTITKTDELVAVKKEDGIENSPAITKTDESRVVEEDEGVEDAPTITKNDESMAAEEEEEDGTKSSPTKAKNDDTMVIEGTPVAETEIKKEVESVKSGSGSSGKRKRGRNAGEDVCFICLDGGDLVLCDHRACPKAYHPSCVDHDAEFFKTKGSWNCGWHLCNKCGKNAHFMCFTCQFSLCKACSKDATIFSVRGKKGFCESCMKTIMMIENSEENEMDQQAFSDKSSWEYLFKDYWLEQKEKFGITPDELSQAKNPWKDSNKHQLSEGNNDAGSDSDSSHGKSELSDSRRKKAKKNSKSVDDNSDFSSEKKSPGKRKSKRRLRSHAKEVNSDSEQSSHDTSSRKGKKTRKLARSRSKSGKYGSADDMEWASKELLEFVMHMKNGDQSVLTQFDVQELLLEYIKRNKLRDPRRQSQIICDSMLQKLFGKPRVGHFEMLKLLESHFFLKDADDNQGDAADTEMKHLDTGDNTDSLFDSGKSRGKKSRKRDDRGSQSNLDDYAAIDMHNINLIFLRRNLMEGLMDNPETFHDKAVGAFVRIRISGSQKQDIYRLVQITGTSKAPEPYKVGKRTTDIMLEILNLDKTETISIDTVSNQEFSEDECKRLRQSIKCGLINRMTVGDVVEKARELQEVRVLDWLEAEVVRLSHLRDRASEKGRKRELRECVEKLQLLKTPEERQRRLDETPVVHSDPKMDPSYESGDDMDNTERARESRPRDSGFSRRGRDSFSSLRGSSASTDSWSANARPPTQKWELNRNLSGKGFSSGRRDDTAFASPTRDRPWSNGVDKGSPRYTSAEKPALTSEPRVRVEHSGLRSHVSSTTVASPLSPRPSAVAVQTDLKINETEKIWHYRDPAGKVQGPFSMTQLRKWSNTGYFPTDLRVWRISQSENDSILLTDILGGKEPLPIPTAANVPSSIDTSRLSINARSSEGSGRFESSNLYSPTPAKSSMQSSNQSRGPSERFPSPTPTSPSDRIGKSSAPRQSKWDAPRTSGENFASSVVQQAASQHSTSSIKNGQQMGGQPLTTPNTLINQSNLAQVLSNVMNPVTAQNPSAYNTHGWSSANMAPNNQSAAPAQVTYGQWSTVSVNNQAPSYGTGYAAPGNVNAWGPPSMSVPWSGSQQQQQIPNPNMMWAGPPTVAPTMRPGGAPTMGWQGATPGPPAGTVNPGWVAPPGTAGTWGGDQNRNGGVAQWNNRPSSNGS